MVIFKGHKPAFLISLVTTLLVPISLGAQESDDCVGVYDSTGTRVAHASHLSRIFMAVDVNPKGVADLLVSMGVIHGSGVTLPTLTPPFHLEPEACFTLDDLDPEQVINSCIKSNGTLKIVADPTDCSSRESPISWLVNN